MKSRLAVFLPSLRGGGAERVTVTLTEGLAARGIEVDVLLAQAEGPFLERARRVARVIDLKAPRVARALPALVRYLNRERPAALLTTLSHANVIGITAARLARQPVRMVVREGNHVSQSSIHSDSWRLHMLPMLARWAYPKADLVLANSEGLAEDLRSNLDVPATKIRVIPNPVDIAEVRAAAAAPTPHPWLEDAAIPVVLSAGRLAAQKDFGTLIRAFARVRAARPARLVLLGEGGERKRLEALVEELGLGGDVVLPGFQANPHAWMARAKVFALSSLWEGSPNVLVEAMSLGVPVVSTDCPSGPSELLAAGELGPLSPVGEADRLAQGILSCLDRPVEPSRLKARAEEHAVERVVSLYVEALELGFGLGARPAVAAPAASAATRRAPRPRVALYLPSLRGGGAERALVNLAGGFAAAGFPTDLLVAQREGPYLAQLPAGVELVDLKSSRVLKSLPGLVRYLRRERPRLMISAMAHTNIVALWARAFSGVEVRTAVSVQNTMRPSLTAAPMRSRFLPALMRRFYPQADVVAVVSAGAADDLHAVLGPKHRARVRVIHNPVVTPEVFARMEQGPVHPWLVDRRVPVVLGVGRLERQKNFEALIQAFAIVRREREARLLILGEGEDRPDLEALVSSLGLEGSVALPGFAANPYAHMAKASLFVLSSRWEGLPSVLIEAMACGCPVVAFDCPSGPKEILDDGRWGPLVPMGDLEALARAIGATLDGPLPSQELSERAKAYGVDRIVREFLAVLDPSLLATEVEP